MNVAAQPGYDRTVEDLGNIVELGHVNVTVPDQHLAGLFYIAGLGLTRDPYLMTTTDQHVDQRRAARSSICPRGRRRWCAARPGWWCPISTR